MANKKQITSLINEWESRKILADEIGVERDAVHKWAKFNRIPTGWQLAVVNAAQARGLKHVTERWMLSAHANSEGLAA